jgi:hypothetical protein
MRTSTIYHALFCDVNGFGRDDNKESVKEAADAYQEAIGEDTVNQKIPWREAGFCKHGISSRSSVRQTRLLQYHWLQGLAIGKAKNGDYFKSILPDVISNNQKEIQLVMFGNRR